MFAFQKLRVNVGTLVLILVAVYFTISARKAQERARVCENELESVVEEWGPILDMENPLKP